MRRARKPIAVLCIAVVVFAALLPASAAQLHIIFTPLWAVVPAINGLVLRRAVHVCHEQTESLLSLAVPRAPPAGLALL